MSLGGCGQDRTPEYEALTQHTHWMYDVLKDTYLWNNDMVEPEWKSYFGSSQDFLASLVRKAHSADKWSYCTVDTLLSDPFEKGLLCYHDTYGMDAVVVTDPTGTTSRQFIRVMTVLKNSPADNSGLMRGDYISAIDGAKVSSSSLASLKNGRSRKLTIHHVKVDQENQMIVLKDTVEKLLFQSMRFVMPPYSEPELIPVAQNMGAGYMMCNSLDEKGIRPTQSDVQFYDSVSYRNILDAKMQSLSAAGVNEMIIDFRFCNTGSIDMATRLASYLVRSDYLGTECAKTEWNSLNEARNKTFVFDASMTAYNLNLNRVYFITSGYTRGAAEWVIKMLQDAMGEDNVIVIGDKTAGQMQMTSVVGHRYETLLCPVVAYVNHASGDHMEGGISPLVQVDDKYIVDLYEYGDWSEASLNTCLLHMLGLLPSEDVSNE